MSRKLLLLLAALMFAASAQQPNSNFTGTIQRLTETPPGLITYIHFDAGARTKWHIHEKGQLVLVEEVSGWNRKKAAPSLSCTPARLSGALRGWRTGTARRRIKAVRSTTSLAAESRGSTR